MNIKPKVLLVTQVYYTSEYQKREYIESIREFGRFGYKILVSDSSCYSPKIEIEDVCDYYQYDRDNRKYSDVGISITGDIWFYKDGSDITLNYLCSFENQHELNIHYCNAKAFEFAKREGYTHILKIEADLRLDDDAVNTILSDIDNFLKSGKRIMINVASDKREWCWCNIFFCDVDWYLQRFGPIRSETDWLDFLKQHNYPNASLEMTLARVLHQHEDEYMHWNFDGLKMRFIKAYRYKETRRFHDSDIYLDFFYDYFNPKSIFLISLNGDGVPFPNVNLIQYLPNGGILHNTIGDSGGLFSWVYIDSNVEKVELIVNGTTHTLSNSELFSIKNYVWFKNR